MVEDTEFNMMTVLCLLRSLTGAQVVQAQNGEIAVNLFKDAMKK